MANPACALARAKLASYVEALGTNKMDKARTLIKGIRLAGTLTPIRKMATDFVHTSIETATRNGIAVPLDYFQAIGRAAMESLRTGSLKDPAAYRTVAFDLDKMGFQVRAKGWSDGIAKGIELFKNKGIDPEHVGNLFELKGVRFTNPLARAVAEIPFTTFEGVTKPWWHMAFQTSLYGQAKVMALREAWPKGEITGRINELLANPTDEMAMRAVHDAQSAVFKDKTVLGEFAGRMKTGIQNIGKDKAGTILSPDADPATRGLKLNNPERNAGMRLGANVLSLGAETVMPYTGVPSSIATKGLVDYTPLGLVKTLMTQLPKSSRVQGEAVKGIARAAVGSTLMGLGYEYAKQGLVSGASPTASSQREVNDLKGQPSNAVKIGNKWLQIGWIGPQAIPFLIGATAYRLAHHNEADPGLAAQAAEGLGAGAKILTEQTYLTGMKQMMDALESPGRAGPRFVEGLLPLPQLLTQTSRAMDDTRRTPEGIGQRLAAKAVPGYSKTLPPRRDVFGATEPTNLGGAAGVAQSFLDPFRTQRAIANPVADELSRLEIGVGRPGAKLTLGKQIIPRTLADQGQTLEAFGPKLQTILQTLMTEPQYQQAPDELKADVLRRVISTYHTAANMQTKGAYLQSHPDFRPKP